MYTERFEFKFNKDLLDSDRMALLREMFRLSETAGIEQMWYGNYRIAAEGVQFISSHPALTQLVCEWLNAKQKQRKVVVHEPQYLRSVA